MFPSAKYSEIHPYVVRLIQTLLLWTDGHIVPKPIRRSPNATAGRYLELGRLGGCEGEMRSREGGHPDGISAFIRRDPRELSLHTHTAPAEAMQASEEAACAPQQSSDP